METWRTPPTTGPQASGPEGEGESMARRQHGLGFPGRAPQEKDNGVERGLGCQLTAGHDRNAIEDAATGAARGLWKGWQ